VRLTLIHARAITIELLRYPAFSVPTLAFPAVFFLLFVASRGDRNPTLLMASFAGFAFLAVAFFQFGVGIAAERETPWERFLRTLPVQAGVRFAARLLSGTLFGLASAGVVALTAIAFSVRLRSRSWESPSATGPRRAERFRSQTSCISCSPSPVGSGRPRPGCRTPSPRYRSWYRPVNSGRCCGVPHVGAGGSRGTGCCSSLGRRCSACSRPGATAETRGGAIAEIA
jgi:hypothetical protein